MKKLLNSDWLRAVQFTCNTSAKSVTPVQITHRSSGLWLTERQKEISKTMMSRKRRTKSLCRSFLLILSCELFSTEYTNLLWLLELWSLVCMHCGPIYALFEKEITKICTNNIQRRGKFSLHYCRPTVISYHARTQAIQICIFRTTKSWQSLR